MEDVGFGYSGGAQVLNGVNLNLEGPGLYCIIGPNGVGKSTLIKCMNKLLKPTSGAVYIDGTDVSEMRPSEVAKKIGYVPVHTDDVFSMTVPKTS